MSTVPKSRRPRWVSRPPSAEDERLCVEVPPDAHTYDGFRAWAASDRLPERLRVALIDGTLFLDMSNEDLESHVAVKGEVTRVLAGLSRDLAVGRYYPDGVLVSNEAAEVSNNPDGVFFKNESFRAGRVRLVPRQGKEGRYREIEGTPDWVLEVVSDSSVRKDTQKLLRAYHRAGIAEYWLVDARGDEVILTILYWRKNGYVAAREHDGWQRSRVFGREFRLERSRDELGLWEYTLHVRPAGR